ncbi:Hsp20/alpha crystallin family protein [Guyparkeria hydrothermalis]|uniref:Hsp20/alpha crystallin family protein n=1 Tax=Guyparkeria hydrothermalis TaxID=923 RepID=UPI0020218221|nr:Hsp20/alpha crystallin family protein [Guyparkeria hydrothermalis]MCL7750157.1 Hsp20/alpha crystallin family protein [Guyparkeria hydrothermalis]
MSPPSARRLDCEQTREPEAPSIHAEVPLRIAGEKRVEREHRQGEYHVAECAYGCFARLVPLPAAVKADSAQARYRNGVLSVTLDKAEDSRRRRIEVQNG